MNELQAPGYVAIEGPIGVGKTSLAKRLATSFGSELILERSEDNPFLDQFYQDRGKNALATQLYFLFQRGRQLQSLAQTDLFQEALVTDFLFAKDRLFAEITLDQHELDLYEQVNARLAMDAPVPDLVVYLQAPVDVLQSRILARNRPREAYIEKDYLKRLSDAYTGFFYRYNESPLLIVNASSINPLERDEDYNILLEQICSVGKGKHYFNTMPLEL
jgi:deoxyguanosine kinase